MVIDKRLRIMQAAEALFSSRRFHEITLDAVAKRADVGKGTIYLYFSDKEDVFFQTALAGFDELCALLTNTPHDEDFPKVLRQTCETISGFFRRRRPLFRIVHTEGDRAMGRGGSLRQRWMNRRKELTAALAAIIARGVESGHVRADIPPHVLAEYFLGLLRTRAMDMEDTPESEKSLTALADLFTHGVMRRPAGHAKKAEPR